MTTRGPVFVALLSLLVAAHGAHANPDLPSATLSENQIGVFSVTHWTANTASCAEEGPSVLGDEPRFFVLKNVGDDRWGHHVYAVACRDREDCKKVLTTRSGGAWIWMFGERRSSTEFGGETTRTGHLDGNLCTDSSLDRLTLEISGENDVLLRKQSVLGTDYPPEAGAPDTPPMCLSSTVQSLLKDKACDTLEVIRGSRTPAPGP